MERGVQLQGLADGELGLEFALLELGAEDAGHARVVGDGVETGDPHPARVGNPQALDALDGGGLPGAVRAKNSKISPSSTAKETPSTTARPP